MNQTLLEDRPQQSESTGAPDIPERPPAPAHPRFVKPQRVAFVQACWHRDVVQEARIAFLDEMEARFTAITGKGYPYIVAERHGQVVGYAYAAAYRLRPAYRFAVENSIYIDQADRSGGIGSALLPALIERCAARGYRQMIAVIGDSANAASIGLHTKFGFRTVGTLTSIGWKHDRWVDSVLMQRALGAGDGTAPVVR